MGLTTHLKFNWFLVRVGAVNLIILGIVVIYAQYAQAIFTVVRGYTGTQIFSSVGGGGCGPIQTWPCGSANSCEE